MKLKDWIVPDEFQSGAFAATQMLRMVKQTSHFWLKQAFALVVPVCVGYLISHVVISVGATGKAPDFKDFISNCLTISSVLAGFIVTLMLFTGKTDGAKSLTIDQAPIYIQKVTYLLFSQCLSLNIYILCMLCCLAWLCMNGLNTPSEILTQVFKLCCGLMTACVVRTLLLPLQIYEVHQFELQGFYDEKLEEYRKSIGE